MPLLPLSARVDAEEVGGALQLGGECVGVEGRDLFDDEVAAMGVFEEALDDGRAVIHRNSP